MMAFNGIEYFALMLAFGINAVVPGLDFAMVLRQSIVHGRQAAVFTSAGIATSIFVHGAYTILGIGLIVSQSILMFNILKFAGAAYLIWLGIGALRAAAPQEPTTFAAAQTPEMTPVKAFVRGFLTNLLNPKAVLFFVALFTTLVSAKTALAVKGFYVVNMSVMLFFWFVLVSVFFTTPKIRSAFFRLGKWFNRATGAAFIFLAIGVAFSRQH